MAARRHRVLRGAIAHSQVRLAQLALRDAGFDPGRIDGAYGPDTERAVLAFQRANGLATDGIVGPDTWRALADQRAGARLRRTVLHGALHGAVSGNDVEQAQLALDHAGFDPGRVDGVYGPDTERAVLAFQRARGLLASGVVDPDTWDELVGGEEPDPDADLSRSAKRLRDTHHGAVTAYALVAELLSTHDYGNGLASSVEVGEAPDGAEAETVDDWVERVRPLFRLQDPGQLDGRKLVYGLALLDPELRKRLSAHDFLVGLEREIVVKDELSGRGKALRRPDAVPTLSDLPARVDLLGRMAFAKALAERLRDEFDRSRRGRGESDSFMLHLEGPWGSGKTSLLGFLEQELKRPPRPWMVVDFNAWRNQRAGAPWWLLISAVLGEAVGDPRTDRRRRLRLRLRGLWWRLQLAKAEIAVVALALAVVGLLALTGKLEGGDPAGILLGTVSSAIAAVSGLHGLMTSVNGGSQRGAEAFVRQTRDPMATLRDRFDRLVRDIDRPLAIFVDDLDRCRADYVVDLLEGVQTTFREAPVAFVVAADRYWLYDAYAKVYGDYVKTAVDPGRPLGHLFLEKTFQLSTSVPRLSPDDQQAFWRQLLAPEDGRRPGAEALAREADREFAKLETEDRILGALDHRPGASPEERRARREAAVRRLASPRLQRHLEHTLAPLATLLEPNPRAMKRLVNAYGVERAIQILEGRSAELEHPHERLALWTILKLRWPLLADYLSEHPGTLDDLKQRHAPAAVERDTARPYLKTLFEDPAPGRVARGEADGWGGVALDPPSLRFLVGKPPEESRAPGPGETHPRADGALVGPAPRSGT
jgi:peptidoglycan hydrolase-like protein with peptidoglycan-binding domain